MSHLVAICDAKYRSELLSRWIVSHWIVGEMYFDSDSLFTTLEIDDWDEHSSAEADATLHQIKLTILLIQKCIRSINTLSVRKL